MAAKSPCNPAQMFSGWRPNPAQDGRAAAEPSIPTAASGRDCAVAWEWLHDLCVLSTLGPNDQVPASQAESWASSAAVRRTMQGNRGRDTAPELRVRRLLHSQGLRYRVDYPLPFDKRRRADIVFTKQKLAIFIDGCFWHACPDHYVEPRANHAYWKTKCAQNVTRDRDTEARMQALGWTVKRFWEHADAGEVVQQIREALEGLRAAGERLRHPRTPAPDSPEPIPGFR